MNYTNAYGIVELYTPHGVIERSWRITAKQLRDHIESGNRPPHGCPQEEWEKGQSRAACYGKYPLEKPTHQQMQSAIAVDSATAATQATSASSLTFSHTTAGSDRALYVAAGIEWFGGSNTGVTYNSAALTQIATTLTSATFYNHASWYMVAPSTGANNVVVTMSGSVDRITAVAMSLTGVDQATPIGTPVTGTGSAGTDPTVTVASDATDLIVAGMSVNYNDQMVNDAGQTEQGRSGPAGTITAVATKAGTGSNVTLLWDCGAGSSNFCIIGVAFKAAVSASPLFPYLMTNSGRLLATNAGRVLRP